MPFVFSSEKKSNSFGTGWIISVQEAGKDKRQLIGAVFDEKLVPLLIEAVRSYEQKHGKLPLTVGAENAKGNIIDLEHYA